MASRFERLVRGGDPDSLSPISGGRGGAFDARWGDVRAIVKVVRDRLPDGKDAQRGIPAREHPQREVAFYRLAEAFGWGDLVPETALFEISGREASAQKFVPLKHLVEIDDRLKSKKAKEWIDGLRSASESVSEEQWLRLVLLDFVAGSRDRHANNVGVAGKKLVAFDNATSFGETFRCYHEVFHKFLFRKEIDLEPVWKSFSSLREGPFREALSGLISATEIDHAWIRRCFVFEFPYRMPWKKVSEGNDRASSFPPRESLFQERSFRRKVVEPILFVQAL